MASMCGSSSKSYPAINTGSYYRPAAYPYQVSDTGVVPPSGSSGKWEKGRRKMGKIESCKIASICAKSEARIEYKIKAKCLRKV